MTGRRPHDLLRPAVRRRWCEEQLHFGLLLALDAWNVYRRPISQTEIEKELRKGKATLRVVSSLV